MCVCARVRALSQTCLLGGCLCDVLCCNGKCWEKCTWICATHTPPSHSRSSLCVYTSGSPCSPQSSLSAYLNPYPAFMLVFFPVSGVPPASIRIVILPWLQPKKPNSQNTKHTFALLAVAFAGIINTTAKNICDSFECTSQEKQGFLLILSLVLHCSGCQLRIHPQSLHWQKINQVKAL